MAALSRRHAAGGGLLSKKSWNDLASMAVDVWHCCLDNGMAMAYASASKVCAGVVSEPLEAAGSNANK